MSNAMTTKRLWPVMLGCMIGMAASSAMAASTWNFSTCNSNSANQTGSGAGNSWSCAGSQAGNKVTVSAWGGKTGATGYFTATVSSQGGNGFGVTSQITGDGTSPEHAIDSNPSATPDLLLLKFDTAVALDKLTVGWSQTDADMTVMAYVGGNGNPASPTISGKTASNLTTGGAGAGWKLIENSGDVDTSSGSATAASDTNFDRTVNSANIVSSWWLISAYSSGFGGGTLDTYNLVDYVKLLSVASKDIKVSEPGTLVAASLALMIMAGVRRRGSKKR